MIQISPLVTGGRDYEHLIAIREIHCLVQRGNQWPRAAIFASVERSAEAHIDDVGSGPAFSDGGRGVENTGDHPAKCARSIVQDLHSDDCRIGSNTDGADCIVCCRDDSRYVCAVPESAYILVEGETGNE